ncbi:MAG: hypothetical protein RLP44_26245 [Aggregatilineales bacterium]
MTDKKVDISIDEAITLIQRAGLFARQLNPPIDIIVFHVGRREQIFDTQRTVADDVTMVYQQPSHTGLWYLVNDDETLATAFSLDDILKAIMKYYSVPFS